MNLYESLIHCNLVMTSESQCSEVIATVCVIVGNWPSVTEEHHKHDATEQEAGTPLPPACGLVVS